MTPNRLEKLRFGQRQPELYVFISSSMLFYMKVYMIDGNEKIEYSQNNLNQERELEDFLESHIDFLDDNLLIIGRQVQTDNGIIDLMGLDQEGNTVIIELKRGRSKRDVISQILDYAVWMESRQYDDLNIIAKSYRPTQDNLHKMFEAKFDFIPTPWNYNQKLYIISEEIDTDTITIAKYLRNRGIDINCVEIKFYEHNGKKITTTSFVVGYPSDSAVELGSTSSGVTTWDDAFEQADDGTKSIVNKMIKKTQEQFDMEGGPQNKYYYMRVKGQNKKNHFGSILCNKKSAHIQFRVDVDKFEYNNHPEVIRLNTWFFKSHGERKISLTEENFDLALKCLEHAFETTKNQIT